MGLFRRMMNIGVGLGAGYLAYKMLGDYNKNKPIEGTYVVVDTPEEPDAEPAEQQPAEGAAAAAAEE